MKQRLWLAALALAAVVGAYSAMLYPRGRVTASLTQARGARRMATATSRVPVRPFPSPSLVLETAAQAAPKKASAPPAGAADNLGVAGQGVTIFQPDPKAPGKFLFKIYAHGITGQSVSNAFTGALTGVSAVLFQKGRATATLAAPLARADSAQQMVTASGRVHVKSLVEPGTMIDADTVVWHAKTNIVDATGHVVYRNGKNGVTLRGPRFRANTALQTITSVGAGQASFR